MGRAPATEKKLPVCILAERAPVNKKESVPVRRGGFLAVRTIYLDNVSTTLLDPRVVSAMRPYLEEGLANPSSPHREGQRAREVVEEARAEVALLAGCRAEEVVFTSSATEANNLALKGICRARGRRGDRLLISAIEHPSVLHPARS